MPSRQQQSKVPTPPPPQPPPHPRGPSGPWGKGRLRRPWLKRRVLEDVLLSSIMVRSPLGPLIEEVTFASLSHRNHSQKDKPRKSNIPEDRGVGGLQDQNVQFRRLIQRPPKLPQVHPKRTIFLSLLKFHTSLHINLRGCFGTSRRPSPPKTTLNHPKVAFASGRGR